MKDPVKTLKQMGCRSKNPIQLGDLSPKVLSSIRQQGQDVPVSLKTLCMTAVPVLLSAGFAITVWYNFTDPLNELITQFMVVMR